MLKKKNSFLTVDYNTAKKARCKKGTESITGIDPNRSIKDTSEVSIQRLWPPPAPQLHALSVPNCGAVRV